MTLVRTTTPQQYDILDNEAIEMQSELISKWKPAREVWSLNYGNTVMALVGAMNGMVVNGMFRSKLKLMHQGFVFSNIFISLAPSFGAYISHKYFITNEILLLEHHCTLCLQLKAAASLSLHGLVYPMLLAPPINLIVAGNMGYRIPYLHEGREVLKFVWSVVKPHTRQLALMLLFNAAFTSLVTLKQIESMENVTNIVHKVHQFIEDQGARTNATQLEMS